MRNLLPVTIGNVIGGTLLVGLDVLVRLPATPRGVTAVAAPLALSPLLLGDPIRLAEPVRSREDLLHTIEQPPLNEPGLLAIGPGVVLLHALAGSTGHLTLRWVQLAPGSALLGEQPTELVVVLTAPLGESGIAMRLVASLKACFRDATLIARARGARTREDLVRILAPVEEAVGTSTLSNDDVLSLLGSTSSGLDGCEAARRLRIAGPNQIERVRRRPLAGRLLEQFWSFFAVLLWIGGGLAFLAGLPELGWAIFAVIVVNGVFSFLQEYRAERAVEALQQLLPRRITVVRDGGESAGGHGRAGAG